MPSIRLFIALPLSDGVRSAIGGLMTELRPRCAPAKWERPDKLHVTIKFLGDTDSAMTDGIIVVLRECAAVFPPFELSLSGVGAFPSPDRPRVIWVGCGDGGGTLTRLRGAIDEGFAALGFPRDERPFHPHVTIARVREQGAATYLTSLPKNITFDPRHTPVSEIFLMKSVLGPAGAEYSLIGSGKLS